MTRRRWLIGIGGVVALLVVAAGVLAWRYATPALVLQDMVAADGPSLLKDRTDTPMRIERFVALESGRIGVDTYVEADGSRGDLILVPGFSPKGKDDTRLVALAVSFARAGFEVHVPDLPGSRSLMVSADDVEGLVATIEQRVTGENGDRPLGIAAVSYAAGPALAAAADPRIADKVDYVVALGGYYDAAKVITYLTTGAYREEGATEWSWGEGNRRAAWIFMAANAGRWPDVSERSVLLEIARDKADAPDRQLANLDNYLGADAQALVALFDNRDPERVPELLAALPPDILQSLVALSPSERDLSSLADKLILVHGRDDTVVPPTESQDLANHVPGSDLYLVSSFTHVDPDGADWWGYITMVEAVDDILNRGLTPTP